MYMYVYISEKDEMADWPLVSYSSYIEWAYTRKGGWGIEVVNSASRKSMLFSCRDVWAPDFCWIYATNVYMYSSNKNIV